MEKTEVNCTEVKNLYVFVFIYRNRKIFHEMENTLMIIILLPNGKKYQKEKLENTFISTK